MKVVYTEGYTNRNNFIRKENLLPVYKALPFVLFSLKVPSSKAARQQHISCNVPASRVFCFSRQDFTQPRLPVRWSSLGPPNM